MVVLRGRTAAILRIWRTGDIALRTALNRTKLALGTRGGLLWRWSKFGGRPWSGSIFFRRLKTIMRSYDFMCRVLHLFGPSGVDLVVSL